MWVIWLFWVHSAWSAGLDQLEIGGLWGHPLATDATALHWNPAGLSAESGTSWMVEAAPQFAQVRYERHHPLFGGLNQYRTAAVAPFAAVKTKLGRVGLGLGLSVPYGKASNSLDGPFGVGSYSLIRGGSFTAAAQAGLSYEVLDGVHIGGALSAQWTTFESQVNMSLVPELVSFLGERHFTNAYLEDPAYATTTRVDGISGLGWSGSLGLRAQLSSRVFLGLSYLHGAKVRVSGKGEQSFNCGRPEDEISAAALQLLGLCNQTLTTQFTNEWRVPWRVQMAVQWHPNHSSEWTFMGAYVRWSQFDAYAITISDVDTYNDVTNATAESLHGTKINARDNRDSFWLSVDGKFKVGPRGLIGGRVTYDHAAVPLEMLSANNFDAPTLHVGALGAIQVAKPIQIGVSVTHQFLVPRTVTEGAFGLSLHKPEGDKTRWFWANNNGRYSGRITRLGLSVRGTFGGQQ